MDQIAPTVHIADCWRREARTAFRYRIPSHHLILIESGRILARPPGSEFEARTGDLVCFRSASVNEYVLLEPTVFYQTHLQFAPPPKQEWTPVLGEHRPLPVLV